MMMNDLAIPDYEVFHKRELAKELVTRRKKVKVKDLIEWLDMSYIEATWFWFDEPGFASILEPNQEFYIVSTK